VTQQLLKERDIIRNNPSEQWPGSILRQPGMLSPRISKLPVATAKRFQARKVEHATPCAGFIATMQDVGKMLLLYNTTQNFCTFFIVVFLV